MKVFKIAMAFVGMLIGAGFASGQEVMQYFTAFGVWGIAGSLLAVAIFVFFGYILVDLGNRYNAVSHHDVLSKIASPIMAKIFDVFLLFVLFGIGVVMVAGAGSNLNQQFGLPVWVGSLAVCILVVVIGSMDTDRVLTAIGAMAPFLILLIVVISVMTIFTTDWNFTQLHNEAIANVDTTLPNWWMSAINYGAVNLITAVPTAFLLGGTEKNSKTARKGGLLGGLVTGLLIVVINVTLFAVASDVAGYDMPMLQMAEMVSPFVGLIMSVLIFLEIWNTAMSVLYSFSTRFVNPKEKKFNGLLILVVIAAFVLSFGGFTNVIGTVYPLIGYGGMIILAILAYKWSKLKFAKN